MEDSHTEPPDSPSGGPADPTRRASEGDDDKQGPGNMPSSAHDSLPDLEPKHTVQTITGATGEPGLPPARIASSTASTSRSEALPDHSFGGSTTTTTGYSTSSSRTHIPSVTSRAFFSPMSSQRLQAHRGQRPNSQILVRPRMSEEFEDTRSVTNRNSTGSVVTSRAANGQTMIYDLDAMPPVSQGTEYSEWSNAERTNAYAELMNSASASKRQESLEPLQQNQEPQKPVQINGEKEYGSLGTGADRSPKAFISSFKRGSGQASGGTWANGHAKLASRESSPAQVTRPEEEKEIPKQDLGSNWEYFNGNLVFCWGGRLQNARDKPIVVVTGILFIVPSGLFFGFSAPWLWHHVSPAIPILFAYIFFVCLSSYLHASLSDPGIFPRNLHPELPPPTDPWATDTSGSQWVMIQSSASPNGAFEVPVKYCKTCNIWRPPRCHHCRVCDSCIDTQDHHCMWLNNCVGRRNYRYFFGFVASGSLLGIFLFAASLAQVIAWGQQNHTSFVVAIDNNRVPFAMFLYSVIAFMYPSALWGYHLFLIAGGLTTREYLNSKKFLQKDRHRPFRQKSWWKNFVVVLMRPRPPTYMGFKKKYEQGDQRFGERKGQRATPQASPHQSGGGLEMRQLDDGVGPGLAPNSPFPAFQGPRTRELVDATPRDDFDPTSRATSMATSKV